MDGMHCSNAKWHAEGKRDEETGICSRVFMHSCLQILHHPANLSPKKEEGLRKVCIASFPSSSLLILVNLSPSYSLDCHCHYLGLHLVDRHQVKKLGTGML